MPVSGPEVRDDGSWSRCFNISGGVETVLVSLTELWMIREVERLSI